MQKPLKLPLLNAYVGRGDAWSCLWVVEGARALRMEPIFYTHRRSLVEPWMPLDAPALDPGDAGEDAAVLLGRHNEWRMTADGVSRLYLMCARATARARALGWEGPDISPVQPVLRVPLPPCPRMQCWDLPGERWEPARSVVLFPGSEWEQRRWPLVHWRRLAVELAEQGMQVVCLGGKDEVEDVRSVCPRYGWDLPWLQVMAIMQAAEAVVCNDSGPLHLGAALGVRAVSVHAMMGAAALTGWYPRAVSVVPSGGCAGCHALPERGYRPCCELGCSALGSVGVGEVLRVLR